MTDDYRNSDYVFLSLNEINVKSPPPPLIFTVKCYSLQGYNGGPFKMITLYTR